MLKSMQEAMGMPVEADFNQNSSVGKLAPVASSFSQRVIMTTYPQLGLRTAREMQTLSVVLDALAKGEIGKAADVAAYRLKALEVSTMENSWARATHLELIEPLRGSLVNRVDRAIMAEEASVLRRLNPKGDGKGKDKERGPKDPSWPAVATNPFADFDKKKDKVEGGNRKTGRAFGSNKEAVGACNEEVTELFKDSSEGQVGSNGKPKESLLL